MILFLKKQLLGVICVFYFCSVSKFLTGPLISSVIKGFDSSAISNWLIYNGIKVVPGWYHEVDIT